MRWWRLAALPVVGVIFLLLYFGAGTGEIKTIWLALWTNMFVAALVVLLIDLGLVLQAERDRRIRSATVLRPLRSAIGHQLGLMRSMVNSAWEQNGSSERLPEETSLDESFVKQLLLLDFTQIAPVVPGVEWIQHVASEFHTFNQALVSSIDAYGPFLDASLVDVMQALIDSHLSHLIANLFSLWDMDGNPRGPLLKNEHRLVSAYVAEFALLVKGFNKSATKDNQLTDVKFP